MTTCTHKKTLMSVDSEQETQLHRPYTAFETLLATGTPREFPTIYVPKNEANAIFPLPRVIFRMFEYTDPRNTSCLTHTLRSDISSKSSFIPSLLITWSVNSAPLVS